MTKTRAARNRTLTLSDADRERLRKALPSSAEGRDNWFNRVIRGDFFRLAALLPEHFADLIVADPPYNLSKDFNGRKFARTGAAQYLEYVESWMALLPRLLKPGGSIYLCGDWRCSCEHKLALEKHFRIRNRIVWQREKGRGAKSNWKNCAEDIWFATAGDDYYFDVDAVKQRRRVLAPYRENGAPKDWSEDGHGRFRLTAPSNFWDDVSVPYWSMPENTDHPTQKPEKLVAKLILASCPENGLVFDPFAGSGTTLVVAKKLGRSYCGVELDEEYCLWALARLERAELDRRIQGMENGVFYERNSRIVR